MSRFLRRRDKNPGYERAGICRFCGCTDDHACAGGCGWANPAKNICTGCIARARVAALRKAWAVRPVNWNDARDMDHHQRAAWHAVKEAIALAEAS